VADSTGKCIVSSAFSDFFPLQNNVSVSNGELVEQKLIRQSIG
jgi:hypothetical protein